jgi:hypothetical protein
MGYFPDKAVWKSLVFVNINEYEKKKWRTVKNSRDLQRYILSWVTIFSGKL